MPVLITTGHAAKLLGVTSETIRNYIRDGKLRAVQTGGGHWRLDEQHVRGLQCNTDLVSALLR